MDETEGIAPTLRDQFAMAALTGMESHWLVGLFAPERNLSYWAYKVADAMLAERDKVRS